MDKGHLVKFIESLESNHPIKDSSKTMNEKIYKLNYVYISNKKLCTDIIDKGCIPVKSMTLKYPSREHVPKELIRHFIRGYVDGDGCITYTTYEGKHSTRRHHKISIIGTEHMLNGIVMDLGLNTKPVKEKGRNHYTLYIGGNNQSREIAKILYDNSTIYLERKRIKANELIAYVEENPWIIWNKGLTLEDY